MGEGGQKLWACAQDTTRALYNRNVSSSTLLADSTPETLPDPVRLDGDVIAFRRCACSPCCPGAHANPVAWCAPSLLSPHPAPIALEAFWQAPVQAQGVEQGLMGPCYQSGPPCCLAVACWYPRSATALLQPACPRALTVRGKRCSC